MFDVLFLWQHLEHKKYNNVKYLFFAIEKCRSFLKIIFEPLNSEKTIFKNWNFQLSIVNKSRMSSKNVCKSSFKLHSWKLLFSSLKDKIVKKQDRTHRNFSFFKIWFILMRLQTKNEMHNFNFIFFRFQIILEQSNFFRPQIFNRRRPNHIQLWNLT